MRKETADFGKGGKCRVVYWKGGDGVNREQKPGLKEAQDLK